MEEGGRDEGRRKGGGRDEKVHVTVCKREEEKIKKLHQKLYFVFLATVSLQGH